MEGIEITLTFLHGKRSEGPATGPTDRISRHPDVQKMNERLATTTSWTEFPSRASREVHASFAGCHDRLRSGRDPQLGEAKGRAAVLIEVNDNGVGIPADVAPGIGLASMAERAEELGAVRTQPDVVLMDLDELELGIRMRLILFIGSLVGISQVSSRRVMLLRFRRRARSRRACGRSSTRRPPDGRYG